MALIPGLRETRMSDQTKSKAQLIDELQEMRHRVETVEAAYRNRLEELTTERTAKLLKANEQLLQQIVEREWAEDALRKIKSRYELAVKAGRVVVWDLDFWSNEIYIDPMLHTLLGYKPPESQQGLNEWFNKVHPDDLENVKTAVTNHFEGQAKDFELEHRMVHRDGSTRWFLIRATSLRDANQKPYRLIGTNTDITAYKQAEEAIHQAHQDLSKKATDLEIANAELAQYAYVVSHDLKAPLRAIHNYADFLAEDLKDVLEEDQEEYIEGLVEAVREAETLVNDLLELSRIGRKNVPLEMIDLKYFLSDLVASLNLPEDAEITLAEAWPRIEAQPPLLRQIFQNLIQNGLTFNQSSPKRLELGWQACGSDHYEFFVRDNGIGIQAKYQEQIFNVFQRLHTNEEYPGTGIGLAIVKKATEKLQGSVRLESQAGVGSTFFVTLPQTQDGEKQI